MSVRITMRPAVILLTVLACACGPAAPAPARPPEPTPQPRAADDVVRMVGKQALRDLPIVSEVVGLPVAGDVDLDIEVVFPTAPTGGRDYSRAHGRIAFTCTGCRIGDDVAKLKVPSRNKRSAAFAGDGLAFGHLDIDRLEVRIKIEGGKAVLEHWSAVSKDLDLRLALEVELGSGLDASKVKGCLKFKATEALLQRDPRTHAVLSTTGAALGPDQLFHIALEGTYGEMKRLAREC